MHSLTYMTKGPLVYIVCMWFDSLLETIIHIRLGVAIISPCAIFLLTVPTYM